MKPALRVYDTATGVVRHELGGLKGPVTAFAMSADGQTLVAGNGPIKRVSANPDAKTGKLIRIESGTDGPGEVVVWDVKPGRVKCTGR